MLKFAFQVISSFACAVAAAVVMLVMERGMTFIEAGMLLTIMIGGAGYGVCTIIAMIQQLKAEEAEAQKPKQFSARECRYISK